MLAIVFALALAPFPARRPRLEQPGDDPAGRPALIYSSPAQVAATLKTLTQMGVDRVRVSVVWSLIAPKPPPPSEPNFDATNPAAYPAGAWSRYDFLDPVARQVRHQGLLPADGSGSVLGHQSTQGAPGLSLATSPTPSDTASSCRPWPPATAATTSRPTSDGAGSSPLPRVSYWGIYNEPNIGGWMTPQWSTIRGGKQVQASPAIYRSMVDAAWSALTKPGHRHDTILIGETAAYGAGHQGYGASTDPLTFMRALYCLSSQLQAAHGAGSDRDRLSRSRAAGAPSSAPIPALFDATGWAHHPYDFTYPPAITAGSQFGHAVEPRPDRVGARSLRSAPTTSARASRSTSPSGACRAAPRPLHPVQPGPAGEYINQGEYMAWRIPRVRSFGAVPALRRQPQPAVQGRQPRLLGHVPVRAVLQQHQSAQAGLLRVRAPALAAHPRHGKHVSVWAQIRPTSPRASASCSSSPRDPTPGPTWPRSARATRRASSPHTSRCRRPVGLRLVWNGPGGPARQPYRSRPLSPPTVGAPPPPLSGHCVSSRTRFRSSRSATGSVVMS